MALLFNLTPLSPSSTSAITPHPFKASTIFRLCNNSIALQPKLYGGSRVGAPFVLNNRSAVLVKASSNVDGTGSSAPEFSTPPLDSNEESVPVENLSLETKLKLMLEQEMRMKMAKKTRLRRKRLVRKRHLRKKGQWPPSKWKNKNV